MATVTELISNVKLFGNIPNFQNNWTDPNIITALNERLWTHLTPILLSMNEEYFTDYEDTTLVDAQSIYELPVRMSSLRKVVYVDTSGQEGPALPKVEVPDIGRFNVVVSPAPAGFYFTATEIVILPTPSSPSGSLRLYYVRRPSTLVASAASTLATITTVSVVAGNTTLTTGAHTITGAVDIVSATSPYRLRAKSKTPTSVTGTTFVFNSLDLSATPYKVAVGDYVTAQYTSFVPVAVPLEWHPLLQKLVIQDILVASGDLRGAMEIHDEAKELEMRLSILATPRSPANPTKINAWR